ncbi:hypothetical protein TNIN_127121 [Trichonephila inaurata madagascariensis]|uniref:Uncharacterized protein n=1 Tax=Trichonephila inaurata madagascariensis TaxID=2747483 RepID=A0A8X6YX23_9ARAC|nr:hypothetical protein TNIN_127121 [Trichonephila inaurata madagascariensis]
MVKNVSPDLFTSKLIRPIDVSSKGANTSGVFTKGYLFEPDDDPFLPDHSASLPRLPPSRDSGVIVKDRGDQVVGQRVLISPADTSESSISVAGSAVVEK